jgi:hypothetical protein
VTRPKETCARCGHRSQGCSTCGENHPFLGAQINGERYCHTLSKTYPTCYMLATYEATGSSLKGH